MMLPKSQRPCRNIEIYGYCKYAGKGCEYNHDINVRGTVGMNSER